MTHSLHFGPTLGAPLWRRLGWGLMGALCLMASAAAWATDDPPGRIGRVAVLEGQVWLREPGATEWSELNRNRPLTSGDRISTEQGARVEVQMGSSTLRLDDNSDLELNRLDDERIDLMLHNGRAALRVREPEVAAETSLRTADGTFVPRGPGFVRLDRDQRRTLAAIFQGEWQFDGRDSSLALAAGQRAEFWVDPADRATHYSWAQASNDDFDRWVRLEDSRETQRLTQQQRYVSPEMTGANDLAQYGRWEQSPDYGAIWTPLQVQVDWAPYRFGHWAWVRPWGWTWVDDAAWGFAPFHYGRWVNWRGRWGWAPGQYVRRPVYAPAMVAWVGQGGVSVSVTVGQRPGGMVGWVPLAPREIYYPSYTTSATYVQNINVHRGRLPDRAEPRPGQPVMYTNRGVPGGVTMVSADVLAQRQPVNRNVRPVEATGRGGRADESRGLTVSSAPPAMGALGGTGRVVREPGGRPGERAPERPGNSNWQAGRTVNSGGQVAPTAPVALQPQPERAAPPVQQPPQVPPVERRWGNGGRPGMAGAPEGDDRQAQRPTPVQRAVVPVAPAAQMPQPVVRPQAPQGMAPQRERPEAQDNRQADQRERNGRVERPDRSRGDPKRDPNQVN